MTKAATSIKRAEALRSIPAVEKLISDPGVGPLIEQHGREAVKRVVADVLSLLRREAVEPVTTYAVVLRLHEEFERRGSRALVPVINATGIIIHTNLGRAPIDPRIIEEASSLMSGYSNLEFDVDRGERGERHGHLNEICRDLFAAEAALLTNNNAGAALLVVAAIAAGKEVVVSRGELVEIGGAFRVPDVISQGGASLREVGTTNRTRVRDYAAAIGEGTAAFLRVHRSNFEIVGFTEQPEIEELVTLSKERSLPLIYDEGSGRVVDLSRYGFRSEPTIRELIDRGVDVVTCSMDKLIGGTQGGLILGRRELIDRCARHPLMRALRAGKESYAIAAATLRAFATATFEDRIPVYRMLATPIDELRSRAKAIADVTNGEVIETRAALGGGTTPAETIASAGIAYGVDNASELQRALLRGTPPVVVRVEDERVIVDMRTVQPSEDDQLLRQLKSVVC